MDLTVIFYSSNFISDYFMGNVVRQLKKATQDIPIVSVTQKPMDLGHNICVGDIGRNAFNIYKQILIGAKEAKSEYVATAEDDVLYPPEHFDYRPKPDVFAYDECRWNIYTWSRPPLFSWKERRNMTSCICNRKLLIKTLEERFAEYPAYESIPEGMWGEPGRYEGIIGLMPVKSERFFAKVPHIMFSTKEALGYGNLGVRKAHGALRAYEIPVWGKASEVLSFYK